MSVDDSMRILEQMRWQETRLTKALEPLRRTLIRAMGSDSPAAVALIGRTELWWQDVPAGSGDPSVAPMLATVPVVQQAFELIDGEPPALPDDFESTRAFAEYLDELRVLSELRAQLPR